MTDIAGTSSMAIARHVMADFGPSREGFRALSD